jgi:hypothetical protein
LGKDGKPFDPERAQATIDKLRAEVEQYKPAAKKLDELTAKQQADEEERLRKQGEFEALAEKRTGERDTAKAELTAANEKVAQYEQLLGGTIDKQIENWPDEVRALVPNDGTPLQRLQKITELEPLAQKFMSLPAAGGTRPGPVPGGNRTDAGNIPRPPGYQI